MANRLYTHTEAHQQQIADVLRDYPGSETKGFTAALRELVATLPIDEDDAVGLTQPRFVPDAYRLNAETAEIEIFEVEVSHHLPLVKIRNLGAFWLDWDAEIVDWVPVLIVIDRYGHRNTIDLTHAAFATGPFAHHAGAILG